MPGSGLPLCRACKYRPRPRRPPYCISLRSCDRRSPTTSISLLMGPTRLHANGAPPHCSCCRLQIKLVIFFHSSDRGGTLGLRKGQPDLLQKLMVLLHIHDAKRKLVVGYKRPHRESPNVLQKPTRGQLEITRSVFRESTSVWKKARVSPTQQIVGYELVHGSSVHDRNLRHLARIARPIRIR